MIHMNKQHALSKRSGHIFRLCLSVLLFLLIAGCVHPFFEKYHSPQTRPEPGFKIVAVKDLGILETNPLIRARDGGYSCLFAGRFVWLYGDTILDRGGEDGRTWLGNSWSWTNDMDPAGGIGPFFERTDSKGMPTEFFPLTEKERAFNQAHRGDPCAEKPCGARWAIWPGAMIADPKRRRTLIFYTKVYVEKGYFNFQSLGQGIAIWDHFKTLPARPRLSSKSHHPTLLFTKDEPGFGSAALVLKGRLYAYGCKLDGLKKPCYVARVNMAKALNRNAWKFYAGQGQWVAACERARPVFTGNDIMSVFFNPYLNRFMALYSRPLESRVMVRTAAKPEGPWSEAIEAFKTKTPLVDPRWVYDGLAHPEYSKENGRILFITYSRRIGFLESEMRLVTMEIEKTSTGSIHSPRS